LTGNARKKTFLSVEYDLILSSLTNPAVKLQGIRSLNTFNKSSHQIEIKCQNNFFVYLVVILKLAPFRE